MDGKKLFTLRNPFPTTDELRRQLNGTIFSIKIDDDKYAYFIDPETRNILIRTTSLENIELTDDGFILNTAHGTKYDIICIQTILPTNENYPSLLERYNSLADHIRSLIIKNDEFENDENSGIEFKLHERYTKWNQDNLKLLAKMYNLTEAAMIEQLATARDISELVENPDDVDREYKPINYGDGWDKYTYEFSEPVTEIEFIKYVAEHTNHMFQFDSNYYRDYSSIERSKDGLTLKWVWNRVYTD